MSRPTQFAPLCASCRSILLSSLCRRPQSISQCRSSAIARAVGSRSIYNTSALNASSSSSSTSSISQFTTIKYNPRGRQAGRKNPSRFSRLSPPPPLPTPEDLVFLPKPVAPALLELDAALTKRDVKAAWVIYKSIIANDIGLFYQNTMRVKPIPRLFELVLEANGGVPGVPVPIQAATEMLRIGLASPYFWTLMIVDCINKGNLWQMESILKSACDVSIPYKANLQYWTSAPSLTKFEDADGLDQATFYDPQVELWVMIFAGFNYIRERTQIQTPAHTHKFLSELQNIIPHIEQPSEATMTGVLAAHGFTPEARAQIVRSALVLQNSELAVQLRALREDVKAATEKRDLHKLFELYRENVMMQQATASGGQQQPTVYHYTMFMLSYASCNHLEMALKIWKDMLAAGIQPTRQTWNALLMGCGRARDVKSMLALWDKMIASGIEPDTHLWTTRVHAFFAAGQIKEGLACLSQMSKLGAHAQPNINTINAALDGLMRKHLVQEAHNLLSLAVKKLNIYPDDVTYKTMLQGLMSSGDVSAALDYLATMEEQGIQPDVEVCTIIINGLYKNQARASSSSSPSSSSSSNPNPTELGETQQPMVPAEVTETCAALIQHMQSTNTKPNATFYTCIIDGLLQPPKPNLTAALDMFNLMLAENIVPTTATYTILIRHHLNVAHEPDAADACWVDALKRHVVPDHIMLENTVRGLARLRSPPADLMHIRDDPHLMREFRNELVERLMWWFRATGELNRGTFTIKGRRMAGGHPPPSSSSSSSSSSPSPPSSSFNNGNSKNNKNKNQDRRRRGKRRDAEPVAVVADEPPANFYRLTTRTYKEVLGRLLAEDKYDYVEEVLQDLARRVEADGPATRAESLERLAVVLEVCGARGLQVPDILVSGLQEVRSQMKEGRDMERVRSVVGRVVPEEGGVVE